MSDSEYRSHSGLNLDLKRGSSSDFLQSKYQKLLEYFRISNVFMRNIGLIFLANAFNNAAMFTANVIVARRYSQEEFGLISLAVTIAFTSFSISEFGMSLTMIRLYKLHMQNKNRSAAVLACNLYFKLVVVILLISVAIIFSQGVSHLFSETDGYGLIVGIALVTGGVLGLWSYAKAFFQIHDRFHEIAILTVGCAALRLLIIGGIVILPFSLVPESIFTMIYLVPLMLILTYAYTVISRVLNKTEVACSELFDAIRESLNYSKWVAASGITFILIQHSVIFMTAVLGDLKQVALLNAALLFVSVFSLLNDSWQQVAFPKIAALSNENLALYRSKVFRILPWFFLLSVLIITVLSWIMTSVLGAQYRDSLLLFIVASAGAAMTIAIGFFSVLMHSIQRPEISFYVNLVTLAMVILIGAALMVKIGLLGLICWYAFSMVVGELVKSLLINKRVRMI